LHGLHLLLQAVIAIKQLFCARTVAVIFNNSKLLPGVDILKEDPIVFRAFSPSSRLVGPHDAIAFYPASIGPDEIVQWTNIRQEQATVRIICMALGSRPIIDAIAVRQIAATSKADAADADDRLAANIVKAISGKAKCMG
jgi:hypothetical protein